MTRTIYCPICHQRLFDTDCTSRGHIEIKCPRCRHIQQIELLYPKSEHQPNILNKTT